MQGARTLADHTQHQNNLSKPKIQPKFSGSNFGIMAICSGHGQLERLRVNHSPRSEGNGDNLGMSSRKHAYIMLTPLNPTLI